MKPEIFAWNIADRKQMFSFNNVNEARQWLRGNKGMEAEFSEFLF